MVSPRTRKCNPVPSSSARTQPVGRIGDLADACSARLSGRSESKSPAASRRAADRTLVSGAYASARIRRAHDFAHALGIGPVAYLHIHLRDARRQERTGRASARAALGHSSVGADPRVHLGHSRLFHVTDAWSGARCGVRCRLRDLHEPGLEHGVQLLPVAAHGPDELGEARAPFQSVAVDAVLAARGAVRACLRSSGT